MVASTVNESSVPVVCSDTTTNSVIANGDVNALSLKTLPKGKYTLVGIDIDTTGRRLIDEIVQLAAYTPKDHFEQYIMPYMNLNPAARQRHQVRVISIGFYRMLKSMQTYKIIKSKSEIAALKDFLDWLEKVKASDSSSNGIIMIYHEERKFIPYMILESLKKYNLLDRFLATVKSFTNGLNLAKANSNESWQHYTLRKLSKVLSAKFIDTAGDSDANNNITGTPQKNNSAVNLKNGLQQHDRDLFDGNASVRAKLAYEVALQLSNQDRKETLESNGALNKLLSALEPYSYPIESDLNELQTQNENLERQNSFRPVFLNYFKTTLYHRVRAVKFRIILAEQGYDLQTLNAIWTEKQKIGLAEVLQVIEELKPDDKTELADLFDSFFDPSKTTFKPVVRNNNRRRNRRSVRGLKNEGSATARTGTTEQGAGGDKQVGVNGQMPDSTTKSPSGQTTVVNGPKQQRGKRNTRIRNNSMKASPVKDSVATPTATVTPVEAVPVAATN